MEFKESLEEPWEPTSLGGILFARATGYDVYRDIVLSRKKEYRKYRDLPNPEKKYLAAMAGLAAALFPGIRMMAEQKSKNRKIKDVLGGIYAGFSGIFDISTNLLLATGALASSATGRPEALIMAGAIKLISSVPLSQAPGAMAFR